MAHEMKEAVLDDPLFGWWSRQGEPPVMDAAHRHNELEFNLLARGGIVYLFPGRRVELHAGQLFFFWSAVPHRLVAKSPDAYMHWMTIPLSWLLHRGLPERFTHRILLGAPALADIPADEQAAEVVAFQRWQGYIERDDADERAILMLEVEARLRRLLLHAHERPARPARSPDSKAELIAHFLAEHYTEEWAVREAAKAAGLHPNYAMALFKRAYGLSMAAYATQLRVALAQQLLVSSDLDALQVGYESGFGSTSRFYAAFREHTGQTPSAYRRSLKWVD